MTHWISFYKVSTPVTVKMVISAESRQYLALLNTAYTPTPNSISEILFHFHLGDAGQKALLVTWIVDNPITLIADFEIATYETHYMSPLFNTEGSRQEEVRSTPFYPSEDFTVQRVAKEVLERSSLQSNGEKARAVYDWVRANIQYDKQMAGVYSPIEVLRQRKAVCEGLAYTFATLCKALGVPARVYYGNVFGSDESSISGIFWQKHCWAEFWDGSNWQPVDPTLGCFGSLSIIHYAHSSFGLWSIDVHSDRGIVWPVNRDRRVTVSGCGLDWVKFIGYRASTWTLLWMATTTSGTGTCLVLVGGMYLIRRKMYLNHRSGTFRGNMMRGAHASYVSPKVGCSPCLGGYEFGHEVSSCQRSIFRGQASEMNQHVN